MSKISSNILLMSCLIAIATVSIVLVTSAFADNYWQVTNARNSVGTSCGDHICLPNEDPYFWLQYLESKSLMSHFKAKATNTPTSLNIIAPDGECNIVGTLNTGGSCSVGLMVVSGADYNSLKSNPAIMAVTQIQNTLAKPTTSYCDIANWIILHEDGYASNVANETQLVDPPYCHATPVPIPVPVPSPVPIPTPSPINSTNSTPTPSPTPIPVPTPVPNPTPSPQPTPTPVHADNTILYVAIGIAVSIVIAIFVIAGTKKSATS